MASILPAVGPARGGAGGSGEIHVTFPSLAHTSEFGSTEPPLGAPERDRFELDTLDILKRISRRPIDPTQASELLADLGFDSLQVLELVGELEDHFGVAVPLNDLTHIRTVAQVVEEVRKLAAMAGEGRA